MNKPEITFVVAAYNVENYLRECLDGLMHSDLVGRIEVLIINDGSTDHTQEIAEEYANKSNGVIRIINKSNGGLASVFNTGVREATGKYWISLDGDDQINTQELLSFLDDIKNLTVDYIGYPKTIFNAKKNVNESYRYFIHNAAFLTERLREIQLHIEEDYRLYADGPFMLYVLPFIRTSTYVIRHFYRYRFSEGQSVTINGMKKNKKDLFGTSINMINYYKNNYNIFNNISDEKKSIAKALISRRIQSMYLLLIVLNDRTEIEQLNQKLSEILPDKTFLNMTTKIIQKNNLIINTILKFSYMIFKFFRR